MTREFLLLLAPAMLTTACGGNDARLGEGAGDGSSPNISSSALEGGTASDAATQPGDAGGPSDLDGGSQLDAESAQDGGGTLEGGLMPIAVVLFGGEVIGTGPAGDTWEWDGTRWTERTPAFGPSARTGAAMAPLGNKVILFGGSDGLGTLSDTWEWDGTSWTQLSVTGPVARTGHLLAAYKGGLVLVGGDATTATSTAGTTTPWDLADTWVFDGNQWTQEDAGSPAFFDHAWGMSAAPGSAPGCTGNCPGEELILFGEGASNNGTAMWDGTGWQAIDVAASSTNQYPPPGMGAVTGFGDSIVLLQAPLAATDITMWQWTAGNWTQVQTTLPSSFGFGTIASLGGTIVSYVNSFTSDFTWIWSGGTWSPDTGSAHPAGRGGQAMATRYARSP